MFKNWQQCTNYLAKLNNILEGKFYFDENWHQYKLALHDSSKTDLQMPLYVYIENTKNPCLVL